MHGDLVSYFGINGDLVSFLVLHAGQASSFGGCMAQASYFDTARRPVSFLAKKARFVTTSNLRSCHKATGLFALHDRSRYVAGNRNRQLPMGNSGLTSLKARRAD